MVDNTTAESIINHLENRHCVSSTSWLRRSGCGPWNKWLTPSLASPTKAMSRVLIGRRLQLPLNKIAGQPNIDLFVFRIIAQLRPHVSFRPQTGATAVNDFDISWVQHSFYAFSRFSILTRVLQKNGSEQATSGTSYHLGHLELKANHKDKC